MLQFTFLSCNITKENLDATMSNFHDNWTLSCHTGHFKGIIDHCVVTIHHCSGRIENCDLSMGA